MSSGKVCPNLIEIIEIIEICFIFANPIQVPTKSYANPIFRPFLGTDLQRTYNGITTDLLLWHKLTTSELFF